MDSFIYDFFGISNTRSWWLSPGQSFVSDFLIPIIASVVIGGITIYYARKSYLLEKKLADLQIFGLKISITSQEFNNQVGSKYGIDRYYHVKYANKSYAEGYIVACYLQLGNKYITTRSGGHIDLLGKDEKLGSLECRQKTFDLERAKKNYDFKNNDLYVVFEDSLGNTYSEVFSREKFPELYE